MTCASDPFADDQVPLAALRRQAYNLRWATQPDDVIPLTAADPDFAVAPVVREAIARHAAEGVFSYGPAQGLPRRLRPLEHGAPRRDLRARTGAGGGWGRGGDAPRVPAAAAPR